MGSAGMVGGQRRLGLTEQALPERSRGSVHRDDAPIAQDGQDELDEVDRRRRLDLRVEQDAVEVGFVGERTEVVGDVVGAPHDGSEPTPCAAQSRRTWPTVCPANLVTWVCESSVRSSVIGVSGSYDDRSRPVNMAYDATATPGSCEARIASCLATASSRVGGDHAVERRHDLHGVRATPGPHRFGADRPHLLGLRGGAAAAEERRLGMASGEGAARRRAPAWNSTGVPCGEYDVLP